MYDEGVLYLHVMPSGVSGGDSNIVLRVKNYFRLVLIPMLRFLSARQRRNQAREPLANNPPINPSEKRKVEKAEKTANKSNTSELWAKQWWLH